MKVKEVKVVTYKDVVIPEAEDVLNFLRDLNDDVAARAFVKNLETLRKATLEEYLEDIEEYIGGSSLIASAFVWYKTPEGGQYWGLINQLWKKHWRETSGEEE